VQQTLILTGNSMRIEVRSPFAILLVDVSAAT
jgi:hypothetical protein